MFWKGKTIYHIKRIIEETQDIVDNGVHEIYVNTKVNDGTEITEYMGLLNCAEVPDNPKFPKICEAIRNMKTGLEEDNMCDLVQEYAKEYADEEKIKLMVKCYISGALSENIAAEMVDVTGEQFLEYVERYKAVK